MTATNYYTSDDSTEWVSDIKRPKRKSMRKTKSTLSSNAVAKGPIKKSKRPGRKPLETYEELPSDPKLKRKVQNRAAQRAFRERKEQYVNELQQQMKELEQAKEKRERELTRELNRLKKENERLKQQLPPTPPVTQSSPDLSDYCQESLLASFSPYQTYGYLDPLQSIFGTDMGMYEPQIDPFFAESMLMANQDYLKVPQDDRKFDRLSQWIQSTKGTQPTLPQLNHQVMAVYPHFNQESICQTLRKKVEENPNYIMTDQEVDLYIDCIRRNI